MSGNKRKVDDFERTDRNKKRERSTKEESKKQCLSSLNTVKRPRVATPPKPQPVKTAAPKVGATVKLGTTNPVNPLNKQAQDDMLRFSTGNNKEIWIRRFPMDRINTKIDGKRVLIVGMSGSGKSTVTLDIMKANRHIPAWVIISPTEARNHTYIKYVHPGCIWDTLEIEALKGFRKRQEQRCEKWEIPGSDPKAYSHDPSGGIILDDVNVSANLFKDDIFRWAYFNSRHDKVLWIQLTQHFMSVPIDHRQNLTFLFLFRQNSPKQIKKIYDEFAGVFDKVSDFKKALDLCTSDKKAMVIDCLNPSTEISERIFWYKAKFPQDPFKVGAKWWWKQLDRMYNENWKEEMKETTIDLDEKPTKKGKREPAQRKQNLEIRLADTELLL